ncbi:MAG: type II secretion system F family protein [Candidatus Omnitrophota bacterium]
MPTYQYKARDEEGRLISGKISTTGEKELAAKLESIGFFLVSFSVEKKNPFSEDIIQKFQRIKPRDLYTFTLQLSYTISSGVHILSSLRSIADGCKNKKLTMVIKTIIKDLESGRSFSESLNKHPRIFNPFYTNMVGLGESSGTLPKILYSLVEYIRKEIQIKRKIILALSYPIVVLLIGVGLITYILITVMPQFLEIYVEQGVPLPAPTLILLTMSNFLTGYWWIILAVIAGGIAGFRLFIVNDRVKLKIDTLILRLPIIGAVLKKMYVKQFVDGMYLLYTGGLPILRSLAIIKTILQNQYLGQIIAALSVHISEGKSLVSYLQLTDFFPPDILGMIKSGEEAGSLDKVLEKISVIYDEDVTYSIEGLLSYFEIGIILMMGLGIGFIAMAILFPIFKLSSVMSGR